MQLIRVIFDIQMSSQSCHFGTFTRRGCALASDIYAQLYARKDFVAFAPF